MNSQSLLNQTPNQHVALFANRRALGNPQNVLCRIGSGCARLTLNVSRPNSALYAAQTSEPSTHYETEQAAQVDAATTEKQRQLRQQRLLRKQQRVKEQATYKYAAIAATTGIGSLAVLATYYRFSWHLQQGQDFPYTELYATLLLVAGGAIGMEYYARWAHKHIWHDGPGWSLHESHHVPRVGPFEANDIFAIMNAVPAMALCLYGFLRPDVIGGLAFGAGLGITLFGISYMFIHDGLVHRRFPVGPIADLPVLKRIEIAHRIHHMDKYGGAPFGLFLGEQELRAWGPEAIAELDELVKKELAVKE